MPQPDGLETCGLGLICLEEWSVMSDYLLLIALGPVQDFIMTARRTRDLWFGSYLLSECSKATAKALKVEGAALIFPNPSNLDIDLEPNQPYGLGVVNNVLVQVVSDENGIIDLTEKAEKAAKSQITILFERILKRLKKHDFNNRIDEVTAREQLDDLLEFQWVAVPIIEGNYTQAREKVSELLAARKATRDFKAVTWIANDGVGERPKSSLDGVREAVTEGLTPRTRRINGLREPENLCGVGVLKRMGARRLLVDDEAIDRFFSTSHVAALPLIRRITKEHVAAVTAYIDALKTIEPNIELGWVPGETREGFKNYDGHILFESRLKEYMISEKGTEKEKTAEIDEKLKQASEALRTFFATTQLPLPMPYYALFHADGDRMGEAISSPNLEEQFKEKGHLERHKALSAKLSEFAGSVREVVERHWGSLVFSGGDDVLAFIPLDTAINCVQELAERFKDSLQDFKNKDGKAPTLSGGLVIAHHLDPLSETLQLARNGEKIAKSIKGKHALAITLCKRSGADRTIKGRFTDETGQPDFTKRMSFFIDLHRTDSIPDGAAYELQKLARDLSDTTLEAAKRKEATRILKRKRAKSGTKAIDNNFLQQLETYLTNNSLENIAQEIIVAKIFAQATDISQGKIQLPEVTP